MSENPKKSPEISQEQILSTRLESERRAIDDSLREERMVLGSTISGSIHEEKHKNSQYEKWFKLIEDEGGTFKKVLKYGNEMKFTAEGRKMLEKAARQAAEKDPKYALEYADRYKEEPYAKEVILMAAEKAPGSALRYADGYKEELYTKEVILMAAEKSPLSALKYAEIYAKEPYGKEVLEKAARQVAKKTPLIATNYADVYIKEPYAIEIFSNIIQSDPLAWLNYVDNPAIEKVLNQKGSPLDKQILAIIQRAKREQNKNIVFFIENIINRGEKYEDIEKELHNTNAFFEKLSNLYYSHPKIGAISVESTMKVNALDGVREIKDLHNRPDKERFKSVETANSRTLYTLITLGEEEVFASTFNGLFNRLMVRLKKENKSSYDLITEADYKNFRTFLKISSRFNRLKDLLSNMTKDQKEKLLQRFVNNIEKQENYLNEAINVANFFGSLKDPEIQKYMQELLKAQYERVKGKSQRGENIYGLLAGIFTDQMLTSFPREERKQ